METEREVYHLKDTINKAVRIFHGDFQGRLNSLDAFSVEKPRNTCSTQLVSSIVFARLFIF